MNKMHILVEVMHNPVSGPLVVDCTFDQLHAVVETNVLAQAVMLAVGPQVVQQT